MVKIVFSYLETANSSWLGKVIKYSSEFLSRLFSSINNKKSLTLKKKKKTLSVNLSNTNALSKDIQSPFSEWGSSSVAQHLLNMYKILSTSQTGQKQRFRAFYFLFIIS